MHGVSRRSADAVGGSVIAPAGQRRLFDLPHSARKDERASSDQRNEYALFGLSQRYEGTGDCRESACAIYGRYLHGLSFPARVAAAEAGQGEAIGTLHRMPWRCQSMARQGERAFADQDRRLHEVPQSAWIGDQAATGRQRRQAVRDVSSGGDCGHEQHDCSSAVCRGHLQLVPCAACDGV